MCWWRTQDERRTNDCALCVRSIACSSRTASVLHFHLHILTRKKGMRAVLLHSVMVVGKLTETPSVAESSASSSSKRSSLSQMATGPPSAIVWAQRLPPFTFPHHFYRQALCLFDLFRTECLTDQTSSALSDRGCAALTARGSAAPTHCCTPGSVRVRSSSEVRWLPCERGLRQEDLVWLLHSVLHSDQHLLTATPRLQQVHTARAMRSAACRSRARTRLMSSELIQTCSPRPCDIGACLLMCLFVAGGDCCCGECKLSVTEIPQLAGGCKQRITRRTFVRTTDKRTTTAWLCMHDTSR